MARTTGLSASTRLRVACVSALVECARTAACARRNAQGARVSGVVAWWRGGVVARWRGGLPLGPQVDRADMGNDCTPMLLHALDRLRRCAQRGHRADGSRWDGDGVRDRRVRTGGGVGEGGREGEGGRRAESRLPMLRRRAAAERRRAPGATSSRRR
eukprot:6064238-Prymnesium_polylepis.1